MILDSLEPVDVPTGPDTYITVNPVARTVDYHDSKGPQPFTPAQEKSAIKLPLAPEMTRILPKVKNNALSIVILGFFLFSFVDYFDNFTAHPSEWEKGKEDENFVKSRVIWENNNVEHANKKQNKTDENGIRNFGIFYNDGSYNSAYCCSNS